MADEQELASEIELETPAIEPEAGDEQTAEEPETETGEGEAQAEPEQQEELDTIELDGKQYQIPKALKAGFMMQADYTQKTQAVAERARELEEREARIVQQSQATEQELQARGQLAMLQSQMAEYAKVNWDQLEAEDPVGAQKHWRQFQTIKEMATEIAGNLDSLAHQRTQMAQQDLAKRFEQTQEYAKKNIKGWTPETDKQVIEWAKTKGATDQNLLDAMSPMVYEMLYLARIGEQALQKTTALKKAAAQPGKPLSTVGGKSNPSAGKSLADMDMDEYVQARQAKGR